MVSIYHDEDGKLSMTHYCAMGNRPHMKLTGSTPTTISLEVPKQGGNVKPTETHMHAITLDTSTPNTLVQSWTSFENNKLSAPKVLTFTKKS
jgi:hypothetical protein